MFFFSIWIFKFSPSGALSTRAVGLSSKFNFNIDEFIAIKDIAIVTSNNSLFGQYVSFKTEQKFCRLA